MGIDIRQPNINGTSESEQLMQIRSYLYQIAEQLNWAFSTIESNTISGNTNNVALDADTSKASEEEKAQNTFNSIKSLIMKSADIVTAYSEEIDNLLNLSGTYAAEANFTDGSSAKFIEETNSKVKANSENIETTFKNI